MMTGADLLFWVVLPYAAMAVFVVGHLWRYQRDQFTWTSRSTQLFERRLLMWGSILFHYGALAAIGGHALGILVPSGVTSAFGISEHTYHLISVSGGTLAALACVTGLLLLLYRRLTVPRVAATTTRMDLVTYVLLLLMIGLGTIETVGVNLLGGSYDYRATVGLWFRGLFMLDPHPGLMASAPLVYRLHAIAAWLLFALWPFTRLVHAWSVPVTYLNRIYILYRRRGRQASYLRKYR